MMARICSGGHELRVEQEVIEIPYLTTQDEDWRFTDAAGHEHAWHDSLADHYPTLRWVTDRTYWCEGCRDEHEEGHLECRICGEHVRPGITGPGVKHMSGLTSYYIDGEPVTQAEAEAFIARARR